MDRRWIIALGVAGMIAGARLARADDGDDAPRAADGYRNGKRVKIKVVTVDWSDVEIKTARAYEAMRAAAEIDRNAHHRRSGFRTNDDQLMFYQAWSAGWGHLAAKPGYSNHQSGRALDLAVFQDAALPWLDAHARRYGFKRTVKAEPWHWEYSAKYVQRPHRKRAQARHAKR